MPRVTVSGFLLCLLLAAMTGLSSAQSLVLDLPLSSQKAEVSQRIGITDITIRYHRPLAKDRKIWIGLVPYGKVWRAGANENTTISFSDPVVIEGKPLDKGTYGLHMIPNTDEWTIIFSKTSTSWGSFTYDQTEDALRVIVKPKVAEMHNALTYTFDQLRPDSAVIELQWEKIAVPFSVAVDVHDVVQASLKRQLRNLSQITWMSWNDAANYLLAEKIGIVMFFDVESIHELDGLLEQLPIWPLMNTRVKQIIAFDDLLANVRSRSEQLKTKSPEARPSNGSVSHSVAGKMVLPMMRAGTWQHSSGVVLC